MSFTRDDVVRHKTLGTVGVVIGAGITLGHKVIYICEVPNGHEFTFFLGEETKIEKVQIEQRQAKLARVMSRTYLEI